METLGAILAGLLSPIGDFLVNGQAKIYWAYLAGGALVAALVYVRTSSARSLGGFARFLFPRDVYRHVSTWSDYKLWLANGALLMPFLIAYTVPLATAAGDAAGGLLAALFGALGPGWQPGWAARAAFTVFELLAIDGGLFLAHYMQHKIPLLWEFHKTHHSAETLTPITVFRMHPLDILLNSVLAVSFAGAVAGLFGYLFRAPVGAFALSGVNIGLFLFYLAGMHLRHSHIWLAYPGWLGRHISSPALHQIHHSADPRHRDRNLAQIFTFWDRMAGTLYLPGERETIAYGLVGGGEAGYRGLLRLYLRPFAGVAALLRGRAGSQPAASQR